MRKYEREIFPAELWSEADLLVQEQVVYKVHRNSRHPPLRPRWRTTAAEEVPPVPGDHLSVEASLEALRIIRPPEGKNETLGCLKTIETPECEFTSGSGSGSGSGVSGTSGTFRWVSTGGMWYASSF